VVQAAIDFSAYLRGLADQRRVKPGDDLITALVEAEEAGDRLTEDELVSTCILLLNAGHEATVNVIGNGMLALLRRPDQTQKLRDNPALARSAIEEMMRFDTPLQLFRRWVLEDITYTGVALPQGAEVALLFGSANRDPARFPNADTFDIAREDNPHIAFSAGIHYCLGAPLARLELEIAVGTLMRRFPALRLDDPNPAWRDGYVIRGLKALKIAFSD
jgi:cytochrome P450